MKKCSHCKSFKDESKFHNDKSTIDGLSKWCKKCKRDEGIARGRTLNGCISNIYTRQKSSSKKRNHSMPTYSKDEFHKWVMEQDNIIELFDNWTESGYEKRLTPSVDRTDPMKPYVFGNIALMTWEENQVKAGEDVKSGVDTRMCTEISQYTLDGEYIATYHSIAHAARINDTDKGNITTCVDKKRTHLNSQWRTSRQQYIEPIKKYNRDLQMIAVVQLTKSGEFVAEYKSIADAERVNGYIVNSNIAKVCKGKLNTAYKFKWVYATNYNEKDS